MQVVAYLKLLLTILLLNWLQAQATKDPAKVEEVKEAVKEATVKEAVKEAAKDSTADDDKYDDKADFENMSFFAAKML